MAGRAQHPASCTHTDHSIPVCSIALGHWESLWQVQVFSYWPPGCSETWPVGAGYCGRWEHYVGATWINRFNSQQSSWFHFFCPRVAGRWKDSAKLCVLKFDYDQGLSCKRTCFVWKGSVLVSNHNTGFAYDLSSGLKLFLDGLIVLPYYRN